MTRQTLAQCGNLDSEFVQAAAVFSALRDVGDLYPDFEAWYWETVIPGIGLDRAIFVDWSAGEIAGVVIAKRSDEERKLCTVWVNDRHRHLGVASRLLKNSCSWLETATPVLTIPEERLAGFRGILRSGHFVHSQILESYYRIGAREHVFNGNLPLLRSGHFAHA